MAGTSESTFIAWVWLCLAVVAHSVPLPDNVPASGNLGVPGVSSSKTVIEQDMSEEGNMAAFNELSQRYEGAKPGHLFLYVSEATSNLEIRMKQQRIKMILDEKMIPYNIADIDKEGNEEPVALTGNPRVMPPQLAVLDILGDYDAFVKAVEDGTLTDFLWGSVRYEAGNNILTLFVLKDTSNSEIMKQQQRIKMILDEKMIPYSIVALPPQGLGEMRKLVGNPRAMPPQLALSQYVGDYDAFAKAVEDGTLTDFLKL